MRPMMYCHEASEKYSLNASCCQSCHDDVDYGYDLIDGSIDGVDFYTCCAVAIALDEIIEGRRPAASE